MDQVFNLIVAYVFPALAVNVVVDLFFKHLGKVRAYPNVIRLIVVALPFAVQFGIGYFDQLDVKTIIRDASVIAVLATMFYETRAYPKLRTLLLRKLGVVEQPPKK